MIPTWRTVQRTTALYACLLAPYAWSEPLQTVAAASDVVALPSATFAIELIYSTSDADASLAGLGLRIHFDATKLTWVQNTFLNDQDLIGISAPAPDTEDFDNSPATDTYIQFAWASFNGSWPGQIPATLANLEFSTSADFTGTTLNLTAGDTATGYSFQSAPIQVLLGSAADLVDTDNDGLANNVDEDDDNDGVLDSNDAFPLDATETLDTDRDGTGNNADTDDDGDGLTDDAEINVQGTNPLLADSDGDSMSDGEELAEGLDPLDATDCPSWYCSSSKVFLYKIAAEGADSDRDGLSNKIEESLGTDKNNPDSDSDGLSDGLEVSTYSTDPLVADSDGDGLSDGAEVNTYKTDPLVSDTDGDSVGDGEEVQEGLDPLDGTDCPDWICGGGTKLWLYNI